MDSAEGWAGTVSEALALEIARTAHAGQVDKAGAPYLGHPLRVADHVRRLFPGAAAAVVEVALLHDVLEDSALTAEDLLADGVRADVVVAVVALTHQPGETLEGYCARVRGNEWALMVKHADLADNTDPERTMLLPTMVRDRLAVKYARTAELLGTLPT